MYIQLTCYSAEYWSPAFGCTVSRLSPRPFILCCSAWSMEDKETNGIEPPKCVCACACACVARHGDSLWHPCLPPTYSIRGSTNDIHLDCYQHVCSNAVSASTLLNLTIAPGIPNVYFVSKSFKSKLCVVDSWFKQPHLAWVRLMGLGGLGKAAHLSCIERSMSTGSTS